MSTFFMTIALITRTFIASSSITSSSITASIRLAGLSLVLLVLQACSDGRDNQPDLPGPYADDGLWLCKPGAAIDHCLELEQTTTHIYEDGNSAVFEHDVLVDPAFDCFYVYPTVDLREEPGNTEDLTDESLMLRPLHNQAARFTSKCRVFAPKYRQMTIGSYALENVFDSEFFLLAYADVEEAFRQYLLENPERSFVLLGHSQGSHVLLRLMQEHIDHDEALRGRMISALTIGPTGRLKVPAGQVLGGTFDNIALCTHVTDTGCVVAFDSIAGPAPEAEVAPEAPRVCVDPTRLGGKPGVNALTVYNRDEGIPFPEGVETDWIAYPELYSSRCADNGFLEISVAENRSTPFTPALIQSVIGPDSLHLADFNFAMGDLLRIVEVQADHHVDH